jgi:hypothetical protein
VGCRISDFPDVYGETEISTKMGQIIPGKGWFTYVRMYGPEERLFDGSYKLPDIEELKQTR